jgi:hypothetical protein
MTEPRHENMCVYTSTVGTKMAATGVIKLSNPLNHMGDARRCGIDILKRENDHERLDGLIATFSIAKNFSDLMKCMISELAQISISRSRIAPAVGPWNRGSSGVKLERRQLKGAALGLQSSGVGTSRVEYLSSRDGIPRHVSIHSTRLLCFSE